MTTGKGSDCGSPVCLLDGMKESIDKQGKVFSEAIASQVAALKEQHMESREFMRELISVQVGQLKDELAKTNKSLGDHAANLYPMTRQISERVMKIETEIGAGGLDKKLAKAIGDYDTVQWMARRRSLESKIIVGVVTVAIIAIIGAGIAMYVEFKNGNAAGAIAHQVGK